MNILILDYDAAKAAHALCDAHIAHLAGALVEFLKRVALGLAGADPLLAWALADERNAAWTIRHAFAVHYEYEQWQKQIHWGTQTLLELSDLIPADRDRPVGYALLMPPSLIGQDTVVSYRDYYRYLRTAVEMKWSAPRTQPDFMDPLRYRYGY